VVDADAEVVHSAGAAEAALAEAVDAVVLMRQSPWSGWSAGEALTVASNAACRCGGRAPGGAGRGCSAAGKRMTAPRSSIDDLARSSTAVAVGTVTSQDGQRSASAGRQMTAWTLREA
jgi:hypothetical protein